MKLYDATVRLGGSLNNEVNLYKITASEIAVLQRVHGSDAVLKIFEVGTVHKRSDAKERARLAALYPKGLAADGKQPLEGVAFINSIFGVGTPLPVEYVAPPLEEDDEEVTVTAEEEKEDIQLVAPVPIKRTPLPRKKAAEAEVQLTA